MKLRLLPLFDNIHHIHRNADYAPLPDASCMPDFQQVLAFLNSYSGSLGTFNSYRRETERLLQWCWHVKQRKLTDLRRDDIEQFVRFCQNPPTDWIGLNKVPRFLEVEGLRKPNPAWRPFIATITKSARRLGHQASVNEFQLSTGSVHELFAILSTLFNFLIAQEYVFSNPVALIRQKSKFIRKQQQHAPIRRLSTQQWDVVLTMADAMAAEDPDKHERTRFILSLLYGMYLRISELTANERWTPTMNHFYKDGNGCWWFNTVGKGNKARQIAVSDAMLAALMRWRQFLGLPPYPSPADTSPLIPKLRGHGPITDTSAIRRLVQQCFNQAASQLRANAHHDEADHLLAATVHWLRHTGISDDVKTRPREHVRDDAGHSSSATTDRYIDVELRARHQSAQKKPLNPTTPANA